MTIDISKLTLEEILELKAKLDTVVVSLQQPKVLIDAYSAWDWSKSNMELLREHKCSYSNVVRWRKLLGKNHAADSYTSNKYQSWDWTKSNTELAVEHNCNPVTVSSWRKKLGHGKVTKHWPACKNWDWSLSNTELARSIKVGVATVANMRNRLGLPSVKTPIEPKPERINHKVDWAKADWNLHDAEIGRQLGCSREMVRVKRATLGLPKNTIGRQRYHAFLKLVNGKTSVNFHDIRAQLPICNSTFQRYCLKAGIESLSKSRERHPWHLMNFDLPNIILGKV